MSEPSIDKVWKCFTSSIKLPRPQALGQLKIKSTVTLINQRYPSKQQNDLECLSFSQHQLQKGEIKFFLNCLKQKKKFSIISKNFFAPPSKNIFRSFKFWIFFYFLMSIKAVLENLDLSLSLNEPLLYFKIELVNWIYHF